MFGFTCSGRKQLPLQSSPPMGWPHRAQPIRAFVLLMIVCVCGLVMREGIEPSDLSIIKPCRSTIHIKIRTHLRRWSVSQWALARCPSAIGRCCSVAHNAAKRANASYPAASLGVFGHAVSFLRLCLRSNAPHRGDRVSAGTPNSLLLHRSIGPDRTRGGADQIRFINPVIPITVIRTQLRRTGRIGGTRHWSLRHRSPAPWLGSDEGSHEP